MTLVILNVIKNFLRRLTKVSWKIIFGLRFLYLYCHCQSVLPHSKTDQTLLCPSGVRSLHQSSRRDILGSAIRNDIIEECALFSKREGEQLARAINL